MVGHAEYAKDKIKAPLLNFQWVVLRVKGGREPGEANP
jgi:hypothetical protein